MSETRKNHLVIDGSQVKEDDHHVASYKPIPESDSEIRPKSSLSKSKEKVSDEAEEKLLQKEDEAKITTRVDMADAKYVVGDHRNGDAKIELDANKRQFSGLTKEELLKYADDPFWVRLRWFMFILFWALWLCMLAGAIAIIVRAPKCAPPPPKTWYEVGPLADFSSESADYNQLEGDLPVLAASGVLGVFINPCENSYEPLDETPPGAGCLDKFRAFAAAAKEKSIKVIVDLTANFVSTSHAWFKSSENKSAEFESFFVWATGKDFDSDTNRPMVPNNWISVEDKPAWSWSPVRQQYYLHQYGEEQPDLNFGNPAVVARFDQVLAKWMDAGAAGVRLHKARQLLVNPLLSDEPRNTAALSATHLEYDSLLHSETTDRLELDALLAHWAHRVAGNATEPTVFTLAEDGRLPIEWHKLQRNSTCLRPPSLAPIAVNGASNMTSLADTITKALGRWPLIQVLSSDGESEVASVSMLLPAAPVLSRDQIFTANTNETSLWLSHIAELRRDASIQHGHFVVSAVRPRNDSDAAAMIATARWKSGHTGYVSVYNAGDDAARADLRPLPSLPDTLTVHLVSPPVAAYTNYTSNFVVHSDEVLVPARSSVLLSYVPRTAAEQ